MPRAKKPLSDKQKEILAKNKAPSWKKGDPSPNPQGRPPGKNRATVLTELMGLIFRRENPETKKIEKVPNPLNPDEKEMTIETAIEVALIRRALTGNIAAIQEIKDSIYGKMANKIEAAGPDGGPIPVTFVDDLK